MTMNGVMAVTLRYFSEVGKPAFQKTICGGIYARAYCIFSACTMSSQRKFTFAISSPDEFLGFLVALITNYVVNRYASVGSIKSLRALRRYLGIAYQMAVSCQRRRTSFSWPLPVIHQPGR